MERSGSKYHKKRKQHKNTHKNKNTERMNLITTASVDVDMWMNDHELGDLDDCFSAMETFDPDDPYYNLQEMEPLPKDPSSLSMCEDRRNSMLLDDMNAEWNNEFQECFDQFHSNFSPVTSPQERSQQNKRSGLNHTAPISTQNASSSEDFDRNFRLSLSNLEQSMRRSEQSRKMLGEHRSAISMLYNNISASAGGTNNNIVVRGRSQLLSYMTSLGNSAL